VPLIIYSLASKETCLARRMVEIMWQTNYSKWLVSSIFSLGKKRHISRRVFRILRQMNNSTWLSSIIFSLQCKHSVFALHFQLLDWWTTLVGFVRLFFHNNATARNSCGGWSHTANEQFYVLQFRYLLVQGEDLDSVLWYKSLGIWMISSSTLQRFPHSHARTLNSL